MAKTFDGETRIRWGRILLPIVLSTLAGIAAAQSFDGVFTAQGDPGPVTLTVAQDGFEFTGTLSGNGTSFAIWGEAFSDEPTGSWGTFDDGVYVFEAYRVDDLLEMYVYAPAPDGSIDFDEYTVLVFAASPGSGGAGALAGGTSPAGQDAPAPAAAAPAPQNPAATNPLAPAPGKSLAGSSVEQFTGTFSDGSVTLELTASPAGYEGTLTVQGNRYPVTGQVAGGALTGVFVAGSEFQFTLTPIGEVYVLESAGSVYELARSGNPLAGPGAAGSSDTPGNAPAGASAGGGPQPAQPAPQSAGTPSGDPALVLATGAYGRLSEDAALAFVAALRFSLGQIGRPDALAGTSDEEIVQSLAANYPMLDPESQAVLADARRIWSDTQANWQAMGPAAQQEFVMAVLALAFGEQTGGSAPAGGGASDGYLGMPSPDPSLQEDTINSQNCWAAAGCAGYDDIGNDFYMDDFGY